MGFIIMLAFSALIAFTDVYDGTGMINFICIYNFAILSIMTLGQVMSFEGNYLDGLMSRKESIYNLLRAKYYLNCIIVFIPFLIMMIPVARQDTLPHGSILYAVYNRIRIRHDAATGCVQ